MKNILFWILIFFIIYILVYGFYYIFMINKYDKDGNRKKKKNKTKKKTKFLSNIKSKFVSEKDEILLRGINNKKKKKNKDEEESIPTEVEILLYKYNLDVSKMNYKQLLKMVGSICAFDIALIITIIFALPTNNIYIELGIGALLIIPVILISYSILGNYLKKKGMTKDEIRKRSKNRK